MSTYKLVKEQPPARRGRGQNTDVIPLVRQAMAEPGEWFRFPRDYSGYPNGMKKRFADEGLETTVASIRNDNGVVVAYQLFVRANGDTEPTEG